MARVLRLFRAPKRRAPMEELASAEVLKDAGFEGCAQCTAGEPPGTAGGCGNVGRLPVAAGYHAGKHHHRGAGRERVGHRAEV
jgi:hypothetical protein